MTPTLISFGYQSTRTPRALRELLDEGGVDSVVDVRLRKFSGFRAFSTDTGATIRAAGREYLWAHQLGNLAYKTGGIVIKDLAALEPLVLDPIRQGVTIALMCACWDVATCHRRHLAEIAAERLPGLVVRHL